MSKISSLAIIFLGAVLFCGCESIQVVPIPADPEFEEVTIIQNQYVIVSDFVKVMQRNLSLHGISSRQVPFNYTAAKNEYTITYDARRSWDFTPYLADANVWVWRGGIIVGHGKYHHIGRSFSLSPFKWRDTEAKMRPLYDELLKNFRSR